MAKKRIDVEIGVKNKIAAGLKSVQASLKRFGATAGHIIKGVAVASVAVGAAIVALGVKAVKAFAVQETAENALIEAMLAHGDAVDELLPKYKQLASVIQDETGIGDESTLMTMAKLRTIGVANDKMDQAIKLTLALGKAGMREKAALRAAADAMNGNTTQLTTYIPELRNAKTEAEKLAIVNDLMVRGYQQLEGELDTNAGRWNELKGRIGDFLEKIGGALVGGSNLKEMLKTLSDKIKSVGDSPAFDAFLDKVKNSIETITGLVKVLAIGGNESKQAFTLLGNFLISALKVGGEYIAVMLTRAAPEIGRLIGAAAKMAMGSVTTERDFAKAEKQLVDEGAIKKELYRSQLFGMTLGTSKEDQSLIEQRMRLNRRKELGLDGTAEMEGLTDAQQRMSDSLAALRKAIEPINVAMATPIQSKTAAMTSGGKTSIGPDGKIIYDSGLIIDDRPKVAASTSMLSTGDLFTMMQTGSDSKATMVSEQQKTNEKLDKLIELTGGVE